MKKLISLILIASLAAIVGCSTITPAPEIAIIDVNPPGGITTSITVTFENKNDIDAIITKQTILYKDDSGASATESYAISQYIGANTTVDFKTTFASLPALGTGRTMTLTFSGIDAYGYNKTFSVTTEPVCY
jgi:hypothetical protein